MKLFWSLCAFSALFVQNAAAHGSLMQPLSREQGWQTVEDPELNIGCKTQQVGRITEYAPGEWINVRYPRNNHVGGFIRWAIIPHGQAETADNFDRNTFLYTCRESGGNCKPAGNKPFSLYLNVEDGVENNKILCGEQIQIPNWLPAGRYVLQWTTFGVGTNYGFAGISTPVYRSCSDIVIKWNGNQQRPSCPRFLGGDRGTKGTGRGNDVCLFFNSNQLERGIFNAGNRDVSQLYRFGKPRYVEQCSGNGGGNLATCTANLKRGVDFEGNDIGRVAAGRPEDCCSKCQGFGGCRAFSWNGWNGGTCFLKSGVGRSTGNGNVVSGSL